MTCSSSAGLSIPVFVGGARLRVILLAAGSVGGAHGGAVRRYRRVCHGIHVVWGVCAAPPAAAGLGLLCGYVARWFRLLYTHYIQLRSLSGLCSDVRRPWIGPEGPVRVIYGYSYIWGIGGVYK